VCDLPSAWLGLYRESSAQRVLSLKNSCSRDTAGLLTWPTVVNRDPASTMAGRPLPAACLTPDMLRVVCNGKHGLFELSTRYAEDAVGCMHVE
jgi:hypothetical protein